MQANKLQLNDEFKATFPTCPICNETIDGNLGSHIRQTHGEQALCQLVLEAKEQGKPDPEIGSIYGISYNVLQQIITKSYGANISKFERTNKKIKRWEPSNFYEETTTVWSFKQRGDWATHDGRYRGNWSPYIPRNVILKYSRPGDTVLDYFVGGGTTAVEAKLLGRHCLAKDINRDAINITLDNISFSLPKEYFYDKALLLSEPKVSVGDARDLSDIETNSVDLICAHPPYAGIIKYSTGIPGDLSDLSVEDFLDQMAIVAKESLRVLKPGGICAILIGDARKSKHVVPIGFKTIRTFLKAGFVLRELVIKRQHNCKTTGFWYTRSIKHNFLLLAHEYLPIFYKPITKRAFEERSSFEYGIPHHSIKQKVRAVKDEKIETTTVWIFPQENLEAEIRRNLLKRFATPNTVFINFAFNEGDNIRVPKTKVVGKSSLIYISPNGELNNNNSIANYRGTIKKIADQAMNLLSSHSFLVIDTKDVRIGDNLYPMGLMLYEDLSWQTDFVLKEIIIIVPENSARKSSNANLEITHRYLLVYSKKIR